MSAQDPLSNSEKPAADQTIGQRFLDVLNGKAPEPDHLSFVWVLRFENQYLNQAKELLTALKPAYWAIEDSSPEIRLVIINKSPIKESSLVGFPLTAESLFAHEYKKSYKKFATWKTPAAGPALPLNVDSIVREFMEEKLRNGTWTMMDLMCLDSKAVSANSNRLSKIPKEVHQRRGLTFFWLYGDTGSGKTLYWEEFAKFHGLRAIYQTYESSKYWHYAGYEDVLVLEMMPFDISRRRDSMGVDELLKFVEEGVFWLKDKHRKDLAQNQVVFVVSWAHPSETTYHKNAEKNSQLMAEILKRIHFVGSFEEDRLPRFQKGAAALGAEKKHKFQPILPTSWLKATGVEGFDHLINGDIVRWEDVEKENDKK